MKKNYLRVSSTFHVKILKKLGIQKNIFNLVKYIYKKKKNALVSLIFKSERLNTMPKNKRMRQGYCILPLLFDVVLEVLWNKAR